jgi:rubrerythrin
MSREDIRQLERMIEVIARAIPKEQAAFKLYHKTAQEARRELTRMLFEKLGSQAEEHEAKLAATLQILKKELAQMKSAGADEPEIMECTPAHEFNVNIRKALRLSTELKNLAEKGSQDANDPSCQEMYGKMKEMSAEIRRMAEAEAEKHISAEKWD